MKVNFSRPPIWQKSLGGRQTIDTKGSDSNFCDFWSNFFTQNWLQNLRLTDSDFFNESEGRKISPCKKVLFKRFITEPPVETLNFTGFFFFLSFLSFLYACSRRNDYIIADKWIFRPVSRCSNSVLVRYL